MTEFKAGDTSDHYGNTVTVVSGPHTACGNTHYLVEHSDWGHQLINANALSPLVPEDPRVEVARRAVFEVFALRGIPCNYGDGAAMADAVLAALGAMEPAAPEMLTDSVGDTWVQNSDGTWNCPAAFMQGYTRERIESQYGPLVRKS